MLPASLLVIVIPLFAALPAVLLRRWRLAEAASAIFGCLFVVVVLAQTPQNPLSVFGLRIDVNAPLDILGRIIQVRGSERFPLMLLFVCAALLFAFFWMLPSTTQDATQLGLPGILPVAEPSAETETPQHQSWTFVPAALSMLSLLSAGLMIRPFVYAALAIVAASAFGALMIQAERGGSRSTLGAMRYLIISVLALPLFLAAGYVIRQANGITDPVAQLESLAPATALLVVGFGLLLGAFPLFTWVHGVAKDAPPLAAAFLATVGNGAVLFLFLAFQQEYDWFRNSAQIQNALRTAGIGMLVVGGGLAWAQQRFSRVLACVLWVDLGITLLQIGLGTPLSAEALALGLLARTLALGLFSVGMAYVQHFAQGDEFDKMRGIAATTRHRWMGSVMVAATLALIGLPGTVGFVQRWASLRAIGIADPELAALVIFASLLVGIGLMRGLISMFSPNTESPTTSLNLIQRTPERIALLCVALLVFVLGIFPNLISPLVQAVANGYSFFR